MASQPSISRRQLMGGVLGLGAVAGLSACGLRSSPSPVGPGAVAAAESARATTGTVRAFDLRAQAVRVDLGGRVVDTWAYGDTAIRRYGARRPLHATAGDRETRRAGQEGLSTADDVAAVSPPIPNEAGDVAILSVTPQSAPGSDATEQLVADIRSAAGEVPSKKASRCS